MKNTLYTQITAWIQYFILLSAAIFLNLPSGETQIAGKISLLGDLAKEICRQQINYAKTNKIQPGLQQPSGTNGSSPHECEKYRLNRACKDSSCDRVEKINCRNNKDNQTNSTITIRKAPGVITNAITVAPVTGVNTTTTVSPVTKNNQTNSEGQPVQPDTYPGLVSIQIKLPGSEKPEHTCAGSIIRKDWVVSAAHCFCGTNRASVADVEVVAGALKISEEDSSEKSRQRMKVKEIICHPEFSKHTYRNCDIALLRIDPPFLINEHVQDIQLPVDTLRSEGPFMLVGWSQAYPDGQQNTECTSDLREISLQHFPSDKCGIKFTSKPDINGVLWRHQMCTFDETKDYNFIVGDSGGPLYLKEKSGDKFTLIGIVSYGQNKFPTVYTEVAYFIDWIEMRGKIYC